MQVVIQTKHNKYKTPVQMVRRDCVRLHDSMIITCGYYVVNYLYRTCTDIQFH